MVRAFALVWLVGAVACGDNVRGPTVIMDVSGDPPAYGRTPFPTDAVRDGDHLGMITGLDKITRGQPDLVATHLAALDGFGLRPAIEFFIDGTVAPDGIANACFVFDVDSASPMHGASIPIDCIVDPADATRIVAAVTPGTSLREGTRYAAVITTDVRSSSGGSLTRAPGLDAIHGAGRWATTAAALDELDARAELHGKIAGVAVFTTQHAHDTLLAAREVLAMLPPSQLVFDDPAIVFDTTGKLDQLLGSATRDTTGPRAGLEKWGTDNPTGIAHDHIGLVATGKITIARFRGDDTGTDGPEDETFQLDANGKPRVLAMDTIAVSIVLPKPPMPTSGFPVVIFGHGLGGSRHDMLNIAEPLAQQGYAILAIDLWGHGSRFAGDVDQANNLGTKSAFTGDKNLRDGFGDDPGTAAYLDFFEGFLNVAAIRDAIRQSALDFTRVATLVQAHPDLTALAAPYGTAPTFDTRRVAYLGESFGTIVGVDLAAIEPSIDLFVLDVPGAGLLDQILPSSATIGSLALPFVEQIYRTTGTLDRFHPLLAAMQAVFDGSDPMTFAPHVLRDRLVLGGTQLGPRSVVCIEVVGDEIMANAGTTALARALGVGVLAPDLDSLGLPEVASPAAGNIDGQTGILVQYEPATHGYNWSAEHGNLNYKPGYPFPGDDPFPKLPNPIRIFEPIYETHDQIRELLATHLAGSPPAVRSTKPPVRDFDGDGKPDDQDPDPLDPAK